mmetsp:Transcript_113473/g.232187  ORF Transcript_113473/g.232187 Transcript_113473/m.232187 type:complete len:126 (-) Transcript_113473:523-900(-)
MLIGATDLPDESSQKQKPWSAYQGSRQHMWPHFMAGREISNLTFVLRCNSAKSFGAACCSPFTITIRSFSLISLSGCFAFQSLAGPCILLTNKDIPLLCCLICKPKDGPGLTRMTSNTFGRATLT